MSSRTTRSLPGLAADLFGGLMDLLQSSGRLLAAEARQTARRIGKRAVLLVPALALCGAGVVLLVVSAALYLGDLLGEPFLGFLLAGGGALIVGALVAWWAIRSLASVDLTLPVTMAEIQKDLQWLKSRLKDE